MTYSSAISSPSRRKSETLRIELEIRRSKEHSNLLRDLIKKLRW
jgi:hypothetical protein